MAKRKPNNSRFKRKNTDDAVQTLIYGQHAVKAALSNPKRSLIHLYATQNAAHELAALTAARQLALSVCSPQELAAKLPPDAVHQGMVLQAEPLPQPTLDDLVVAGKLLVVLDQVSDPRNVGAILRACAVFGAGGVIMTRHNSPPAAGTLAKTASGALEVVPLVEVANLARALEQLQKAGYLTIGLDERGTQLVSDVPRDRPIACVMGAEGKGLRRLTRETCDILTRLPVAEAADGEAFATLNVATATAVTLYALTN